MSIALLRQQLRDLATARDLQATVDLTVKTAEAAFRATNAVLYTEQASRKEQVAALELSVRSLAAAVYLETKVKKPIHGIEIKEYGVAEILDEAAALEWARKSNIGLVPESIDQKAILKVAGLTPLTFVKYGTEARVLISKSIDVAQLADLTPAPEAATV